MAEVDTLSEHRQKAGPSNGWKLGPIKRLFFFLMLFKMFESNSVDLEGGGGGPDLFYYLYLSHQHLNT